MQTLFQENKYLLLFNKDKPNTMTQNTTMTNNVVPSFSAIHENTGMKT